MKIKPFIWGLILSAAILTLPGSLSAMWDFYDPATNMIFMPVGDPPSGVYEGQPVNGLSAGSPQPTSQAGGTYQASTDFSSAQGIKHWMYLDSKGFLMTYDTVNGRWQGQEPTSQIWGNGGHPGNASDIIRRFTVPLVGSAHITGSAFDNNTSCGDGVIVTITKNGAALWTQTLNNGNTTGFNFDLSTDVTVWDTLDFIINKRGNSDCDATGFDPKIVLTAAGTVNLPKGPLSLTPGDYNGDRKTDLAVFRPNEGTWWVNGQISGQQWGLPGDIPVPGDYNGDGKIDLAVLRPNDWTWWVNGQISGQQFGLPGDIPVPGDYNGDGKTDLAVFRPSDGTWWVSGQISGQQFGLPGDIPVPGDYNGDGKTDLAVFRPSEGTWWVNGQISGQQWGLPGDIPVPGDYNGDGKTDLAVFRPSDGTWWVNGQISGQQFGLPGDIPVPGDYNGDGKTDIAVFRPSDGTWWVSGQISGQQFGLPGDIPAVNTVITPSAIAAGSDSSSLFPSTPPAEIVWVEDTLPAGAQPGSDGGDGWSWITQNPTPFSGRTANQSAFSTSLHQHYFSNATQTLQVNTGDYLFAYVYLDPANPPSEVMLQWNDGSWEHRAYWGADQLPWGDPGVGHLNAGALPPPGQWVKLTVPASQVGLEGHTLNGMAFSLFGGRATWDHAGKGSGSGTTSLAMGVGNGPKFGAPANSFTVNDLRVYPNPWRVDRAVHPYITFDQIPANTTIKIFTVSGHWVKTLVAPAGSVNWDMTNDSGDKVASGLYLYLATANGQKKRGQLAIAK